MRAPIAEHMLEHAYSERAAKIVRSCVHCGFCNATCPTYQLTGDELEGPRGRIYLIKALLDGAEVGEQTRTHLDQCLLCRNCETTCPSGVQYGALVEMVRPEIDLASALPWHQRVRRWLLASIVPYPRRLRPLVALGYLFKPLLPSILATKLPKKIIPKAPPAISHQRKVLLLGGCAQAALAPNIDASAQQVFAHCGIDLLAVPESGCCGALPLHLGRRGAAVQLAKANLDAWWPLVEQGAEAVIATSSGCGVQLKDYDELLADEPAYAERAKRLVELVRDPIELLEPQMLNGLVQVDHNQPIAFQTPCTLQHGQQLGGRVEALLSALGCDLTPVGEAHLCCGSAGSYSVLYPDTARRLGARKLENLMAGKPQVIVTANVGCQLHLGASATVPVQHWLEFLADRLP